MPVSASPLASGPAAGFYAEQADVCDLFGQQNVARWSQLDNESTTADDNRVARALSYADAEIDNFFRGGPYAVPLAGNGPAARRTVTQWAATIAGVWLYNARGQRDPADAARFAALLAAAYTDMAHYRCGAKRLDAAPGRYPMPSSPVGV